MRIAGYTLLIIMCAYLSGCVVNPVTGKRELALVTEGQELSIGREQYVPAQQSQGGRYKVDESLERYISTVGQRVAAVSDRDLPYEFVVLNNSTPNAWALPGGKLAINRGLLVELDNEAELAAVLGHEVVHSAARHGAMRMQRGLLFQGLVMATAISVSDSDYANYIVGGAQVGAQLLNQKYGRDAELEADYYGTQYLAEAGYHPQAAVSLQEKFVELSKDRKQGWLEGLFSSHPPSLERVAANRETARALGNKGKIGHEEYDRALAYLRSRQPAYDAFDEAHKRAVNDDLETAMNKINEALALEPKEPRFYGLKGDILFAQRRYRAAEQTFSDALQRDPAYYEYYLGRGLARSQLGNTAAARRDLTRSNELLPTAIATNELGKLSLDAGNREEAKRYFQMAMEAPGKLGDEAKRRFVSLDLSDNPGRYFASQVMLTSAGNLVGTLSNRTNLPVARVEAGFEVTVNDRRLTRVVTVGTMKPGETMQIDSGWRFSEDDALENARVQVIKAEAR